MGAIITLTAAITACCLTVLVYIRRPPSILWPSLFIVYLAVSFWALGELFTTYLTTNQQSHWMWLVIEYLGVICLPPAWWILTLGFAEMCGHPVRWARRPFRYAPTAFASVYLIILITNPIHRSFLLASVGAPPQHETLWYPLFVVDYAVILASISVLIWLGWKTRGSIYAAQVSILVAGVLVPMAANCLYLAKIVDFGFDITVGAFVLTSVAFFYATYRHRLFALNSDTLNHVVCNEPDALIITDCTGHVCFANSAAETLFGRDTVRIDSLLLPVLDALFERPENPDEAPGFATLIEPSLPEDTLLSGQLLHLRGAERRFVFQQTRIPDWRNRLRGVGIRLIDVTEAEEAKGQIAEQASAMEAILGSVVEGILVVDYNGNMTYSNSVFQEMWNLPDGVVADGSDESAVQYVLDQLVDPEAFRARVRELYDAPTSVSDHDEIHLKDGRVFERSSKPLYNGDNPVGRVWTFRDVTAVRAEAEERRKLDHSVLEAQKLDSLGMLAGGIAHDFNNILVGVLGNAELALESIGEDSPLRRQLTGITQASHRAGELCRQLLAYSGRGQFVVIPVDLSEVVADMASLLSVSVSRNCTIKTSLADTLPAVEADLTQLRQVIMNFMSNASEAVGDKDSQIFIRTGMVVCSREELSRLIAEKDAAPGPYIYIEVEDTGHGIEESDLRRMFDPFFSTKFAGRGLGLAAVRGIARSHRAVIDVSSKLGSGTRIRMLFPASAAEAKSIREEVPTQELQDAAGTVLVVDDEPQVLDVMKQILLHAGYTVVTAIDGNDAMEVFEERHEELRAVVLDMTMPGLSGKEAYKQMRGITAAIPIVLASGYSQEEVIERIGDTSAPLFLQKPFRSKELLHAVDTAIRTTN